MQGVAEAPPHGTSSSLLTLHVSSFHPPHCEPEKEAELPEQLLAKSNLLCPRVLRNGNSEPALYSSSALPALTIH